MRSPSWFDRHHMQDRWMKSMHRAKPPIPERRWTFDRGMKAKINLMNEVTSKATGETFAELFEATSAALKEGEVVSGTVLSIDDENVQIDIGFKSEGLIPTWEFMDDDGTIHIVVGDEIEVLLEEAEDARTAESSCPRKRPIDSRSGTTLVGPTKPRSPSRASWLLG